MGKTYNLILNSANSTNKTNNNDVTYNIEWGFLPSNKQFKVSFNFFSQSITNLLGDSVTQLVVYLDGSPTTYKTTNNAMSFSQSLSLGILYPGVVATGVAKYILRTDWFDNPNVYLQSKPTNNQLRVQLQTLLGTTTAFVFDAGSEYILNLQFEEID